MYSILPVSLLRPLVTSRDHWMEADGDCFSLMSCWKRILWWYDSASSFKVMSSLNLELSGCGFAVAMLRPICQNLSRGSVFDWSSSQPCQLCEDLWLCWD